MVIDRAVPGDEVFIRELLLKLEVDENEGKLQFPLLGAHETIDATVAMWLRDESRRIFLAVDEETVRPVGFVHGLIAVQPHMVPPVVLHLESLYVEPAARKTKAARGLIKALKSWAESYTISTGAPLVKYAQWMARPSDRQIKRYLRKKAKPFGVLFYKRLKDDLI